MSFSKEDSGARITYLGDEANNTDGDDSIAVIRTKSPQSAEEVALEASVPTDADVSTLYTLTDRRILQQADNVTQLHYNIALRRGGYGGSSVGSKFNRIDRAQRGLRGTSTAEPVRALRINYTKSKPEITTKDWLAADRSNVSGSSSCVRYKVTVSPRKNFVNYLDTTVGSSSSPDSPPTLTATCRPNSPKRSPRLKLLKHDISESSVASSGSAASCVKLEFDSDDSSTNLPSTPPRLQRILDNANSPPKTEGPVSMKHMLKQKWKQITELPSENTCALTPLQDVQSKNSNHQSKPRSTGKKVDAFRFLRQTSSGRIVKRTRLAATDIGNTHVAALSSSQPSFQTHAMCDSPEDDITYLVKSRSGSLLQTPSNKVEKGKKSPSPETVRLSSRKNSEAEDTASSSEVSSWSGLSVEMDTDAKSLTERLEELTSVYRSSEDARSISGKSEDLRSLSEKSEDTHSVSDKSEDKGRQSYKSEEETLEIIQSVDKKVDDAVFVKEKIGAKGTSKTNNDPRTKRSLKNTTSKLDDVAADPEMYKNLNYSDKRFRKKSQMAEKSNIRATRIPGGKFVATKSVKKSETLNENSEFKTDCLVEPTLSANARECKLEEFVIDQKPSYTVNLIEKVMCPDISSGNSNDTLAYDYSVSDRLSGERQLRKRKARDAVENESRPRKTQLFAKPGSAGPLKDSKESIACIRETFVSLPEIPDDQKCSKIVSSSYIDIEESGRWVEDIKPDITEDSKSTQNINITNSLVCNTNTFEPKVEFLTCVEKSSTPPLLEVSKHETRVKDEKKAVEQNEVMTKVDSKDNQPVSSKGKKLVRELSILIEESRKATKLVGNPKARLRPKSRGMYKKRTECERLVSMMNESVMLQPLISTINTQRGFQLRKMPLTSNRQVPHGAKLQRELVPVPLPAAKEEAKFAAPPKYEKTSKNNALRVKRNSTNHKAPSEAKKLSLEKTAETSAPKKKNVSSLVAQKKKAIKMQLSIDKKKKKRTDKKSNAVPQRNMSYSAKAAKQRLLKDLQNKVKPKFIRSPSLSPSSTLSVPQPITTSAATNFHWIQPAPVGAPLHLSSDGLQMYTSQDSMDLTSSSAQRLQPPSFFLRVPVISLTPTPIPNNLIISSCSPSTKIKTLTKKIADSKDTHKRSSVRQAESAYKYKEIAVKSAKNYTQILLLSNTKLKHGLNPQVFRELKTAFASARKDPNCRLILLSSTGSMFCSGLDLVYLMKENKEQRQKVAVEMVTAMKDFLRCLISFPRPVVASVNGAAIGLGVTLLPLCDIVYASDKATFYTPYARLNQVPEGCASCTFPKFMDMATIGDLLYGNRRLTAEEAHSRGLVSQVFWPTMLQEQVIPRIVQMASQNVHAMEATKALVRQNLKAELEVTLENECQLLMRQWCTADCQRAMKALLEQEAGL